MDYLSSVTSSVKDRLDLARGTELEKKVKAATSPENWGATGTLKTEIANATFDYSGFREVMPLLWRRVQENPKNHTIIYKALLLLEHMVRHGSQKVIDDARDNLSKLRMLQEFQYEDEQGRERGTGIRSKAKEVCDLLMDDEQLRTIRAEAQKNRDKYVGMSSEGQVEGGYGGAHYLQEYDRGVGGNSSYSDAPRDKETRTRRGSGESSKPKKKTTPAKKVTKPKKKVEVEEEE